MEQANQATGISDCLFVPDDLFCIAASIVVRLVLVLLATECLVCLAHGEDQQEGVSGSRHKGEQLGLVDAEDVMEGELVRETQLVDEGGHDLWVVLCETCQAGCCCSQAGVLPRGMNLFFPAGTSGLSPAMAVVML